ncbi:mitochondrial 37S ribosomal protein mS35 [Colletotrichum truncatum]|uniref:37s ribosomal protein n=1 Tax=Colletotrichum truncatum TaxID=5467 RepID=A0ACC3ZDJ5_COLTU|nr:37s ribosomal protein [Colletotrichum truncatum]KAF6794752.1 37s ribosomal protein [Colletotrichum truncatum]
MAAAGQALRFCVRSSRRISTVPRIAPRAATQFSQSQQRRAFAVSFTKRQDGEDASLYTSRETVEEMLKRLRPEEIKALEGIRKRDPSAQQMSLEQYLEREMTADEQAEDEPLITNQEFKKVVGTKRVNKQSFWYDEDDPTAETENVMDEFDEDDITPMAHGKLDEIREHRHYHRIMAWEMPLLAKLAKPFEPPAKDEVLRFRYTTYMGEFHPAEKKVVVQFSPADLNLTPVQANKLRKLAGSRYNPETDIIKMSSEKYENQAQNKRYLSDLVDKLVANAKDSKDTFEDIPLDTRHHQFKSKPKFPVEWRMTEERRKELEAFRLQELKSEAAKEEGGQIVDGADKIKEFLSAPPKEADGKVAELVGVRSRGGKQKAARR